VRFEGLASAALITASNGMPWCCFAASSMSASPLESTVILYFVCNRASACGTSGKHFSRSMHETSQRTSSSVCSMRAREYVADGQHKGGKAKAHSASPSVW
jgi:hypothetical protein